MKQQTTIDRKWHVLADPVWKDKHPLHEARYVATSTDTEVYNEDSENTGWRFANHEDSIVCTMPDSPTQKADARLIASAPQLLDALKAIKDLSKYGSAFLPDMLRIVDSAILLAE